MGFLFSNPYAKSDVVFPTPRFSQDCLKLFKDLKDAKHLNVTESFAKCPLVETIQTWRMLRKHELTFEEGVRFMKKEPHWPLRAETIPMLEKKINAHTSKKVIREWFVGHAPTTAQGMDAFLGTLGENERKHHQFVNILRNFWLSDYMTPKEQGSLLAKYGNLLTQKDHQQRVEMLLWKRRVETASALLPRLDIAKRSVYQEWINLINRKSKLTSSTHPGVATTLAQNALRGDNAQLAAKLLLGIDTKRIFVLRDVFFRTILRTVRTLIEAKDYATAHTLAQKGLSLATVHQPQSVELHWLVGWVLTSYLNQPSKGLHHFIEAASLAKISADKAQYAFWAGRAAKAAGQSKTANHWLEHALQFPQTFYGQLAAKELDRNLHLKAPEIHDDEIRHFATRDIVQAIQFLHEAREHTIKNALLDALQDGLKTGTDYALGFYFTQQYSTPYYTIHYYEKVNKVYNLVTPDVFLRIDFQPAGFADIHFIHAMAFNESRFHPMIKSDMGALGLMQITPLTGRHLSSKGHYYKETLLYKDPAYNLKMGSVYLKELFERFHESYLLLAAAYNAGPTYISHWLKQVGHPKHDWDYEWIEGLAYKETRDYVKKLLGMRGLYARFSNDMRVYTPQELLDAYVNGCL
jgi:soluble lytic murein transglycosylase